MARRELLVDTVNINSTRFSQHSHQSRSPPNANRDEEKIDSLIDTLGTEKAMRENINKKQWKIFAGVILFLVLTVGVLAGFLISELTRKQKFIPYQTPAPTPSTSQALPILPTMAPTGPLSFLPDHTKQAINSDASSPQSKAWIWLQTHPDFNGMSSERKRQLIGLVTLYHATSGDIHWEEKNNWLDASVHECAWEHSDCTLGGQYKALTLINQGLLGHIPPELGFLTSLIDLVLWDNGSLKGPIPTELGHLVELSHLALVNNDLTGWIPSQLGLLTDLNYLAASMNNLYGTLPTEIGRLTKLEWLNLFGNRLRGSLPVELWGLWDLEHLFLYENEFSGTIPHRVLSSMTNLKSFGLYQNRFAGSLPADVGDMTALTWLSLSNNQFSGRLPSSFGELTALTWLSLRENQFEGSIPDEFDSMTALQTLYFVDNDITGTVPTGICELPKLQFLLIDCSAVTCTCSSNCGCN